MDYRDWNRERETSIKTRLHFRLGSTTATDLEEFTIGEKWLAYDRGFRPMLVSNLMFICHFIGSHTTLITSRISEVDTKCSLEADVLSVIYVYKIIEAPPLSSLLITHSTHFQDCR
jgi:hypothetical protein